jgi:hypothetical protein
MISRIGQLGNLEERTGLYFTIFGGFSLVGSITTDIHTIGQDNWLSTGG